jgi:hypothetical protein
MMKPKRKPTKSHRPKVMKRKPLHNDLDVLMDEIVDNSFEYGDTNDLFEENIRETVQACD